MKIAGQNPFDSLYVTETIDPVSFVTVFSPLLVHDTLALFRPGNVVLVGTQGSGKSMLLTLLKPETRAAFARAREPFPLDDSVPGFVGAGINLTRSGAIDFGQRPFDRERDPALIEAYFADFLNSWIVRDLLRSVVTLSETGSTATFVTLGGVREDFAIQLAESESWSGAFAGIRTFEDLQRALDHRVRAYRSFLNFNIPMLPASISETKSGAGQPISAAAELLRENGLISSETEIFIRIDQYEELERLNALYPDEEANYESVVHKMLGMRDPRVSYRIGTRRHAWPRDPRMQGTTAVLEEMRNYRVVDLDELLRRKEHSPGLFGRFAEDVFRRRLNWAGYRVDSKSTRYIGSVFGRSLPPREEAKRYVKEQRRTMALHMPGLDEGCLAEIERLWHEDPLVARLGEAWFLQKGELSMDARAGVFPWDGHEWWQKERVPQALLQVAARHRQRMIFAGGKDVTTLASSNILAFVSLCQSIWDAWLRSEETAQIALSGPPSIEHPNIQQDGVYRASTYWFRKIRSDSDGDSRQKFVNLLGTRFREWLRADDVMSYPGHNGFSVEIDELNSDPEVRTFLERASSYGVLVDREHTNRNRGGGRRVKWYLSSIYCPYFQIPTAHVKEPRYVRVAEVRQWMVEAGVLTPPPKRSGASAHPRLFET